MPSVRMLPDGEQDNKSESVGTADTVDIVILAVEEISLVARSAGRLPGSLTMEDTPII
jgi:hypothetical protein